MFHLPSEQSSLSDRKLDEWGQVQPPNQDPSQVPREVHRGVEGWLDFLFVDYFFFFAQNNFDIRIHLLKESSFVKFQCI